MDAVTNPLCEQVTFMSSAQIGKTEGVVLNTIGYYIDQDPAPMLVVQETLDTAKSFSKDRLTPMLRDTPCLRGRVKDARTRDSDNVILHKSYPGGQVDLAGSNSGASLASKPKRIILLDEIDKYQTIKGGDPAALAIKRATTFWNRKIVRISTPRDFGVSRIEHAFLKSDRRFFHVPCPHCGEYQAFGYISNENGVEKVKSKWENLHFERKDGKIEAIYYECEACKKPISHYEKHNMLKKGKWIAERELDGHAGFWLNELYSPWVTWEQMVNDFLHKKDNPDTLKSFINESLGETWEEKIEKIDVEPFLSRRENYEGIPQKAIIVVCSVDVQDDRLEAIVKAYGLGKESWGIDHSIFHGNPEGPQLWEKLDEYLNKPWQHESGRNLPIDITFIDSSFLFKRICEFTKPRYQKNIFAYRGASEARHELVSRKFSVKNALRAPVIYGGPNEGKSVLFSRLAVPERGPLYMHWNKSFDDEYFKQLLQSERPSWEKGLKIWKKVSASARNEALDLEYMNICAVEYFMRMRKPKLEEMAKELSEPVEEIQEKPEENEREKRKEESQSRRLTKQGINPFTGRKKGRSWIGGW